MLKASHLRDVVGVAGFASLVYGIWLVSQPGAFVVGGALALGIAVAGSLRRPPQPKKAE